VSGLTGLVNHVVPPKGLTIDQAAVDKHVHREPISPSDVLEGVREDFTTNCYLWTGNITENIYSEGAHPRWV
jgi:hypothetical protein